MKRTGNACVRAFCLTAIIGLFTATSGSAAIGNENCRRLEDLSRQYAGVQLTSAQQQIKRRLVSWYNGNCRRMQSAEARR
jgi:hypothetical protein